MKQIPLLIAVWGTPQRSGGGPWHRTSLYTTNMLSEIDCNHGQFMVVPIGGWFQMDGPNQGTTWLAAATGRTEGNARRGQRCCGQCSSCIKPPHFFSLGCHEKTRLRWKGATESCCNCSETSWRLGGFYNHSTNVGDLVVRNPGYLVYLALVINIRSMLGDS